MRMCMSVCLRPSVLTLPHPVMAEGGSQACPDLLPRVPGTGWWFCQMKTKRGWVPASYLEPLDSPDEAEDPEPNYEGTRCLPQLQGWEEEEEGPKDIEEPQ